MHRFDASPLFRSLWDLRFSGSRGLPRSRRRVDLFDSAAFQIALAMQIDITYAISSPSNPAECMPAPEGRWLVTRPIGTSQPARLACLSVDLRL
jgi:hypothetical protein